MADIKGNDHRNMHFLDIKLFSRHWKHGKQAYYGGHIGFVINIEKQLIYSQYQLNEYLPLWNSAVKV